MQGLDVDQSLAISKDELCSALAAAGDEAKEPAPATADGPPAQPTTYPAQPEGMPDEAYAQLKAQIDAARAAQHEKNKELFALSASICPAIPKAPPGAPAAAAGGGGGAAAARKVAVVFHTGS